MEPPGSDADLKTAKTVCFASRVQVAMTSPPPPVSAGDEVSLGRFGCLLSWIKVPMAGRRGFKWAVEGLTTASNELETMIDGVRLRTSLRARFHIN